MKSYEIKFVIRAESDESASALFRQMDDAAAHGSQIIAGDVSEIFGQAVAVAARRVVASSWRN